MTSADLRTGPPPGVWERRRSWAIASVADAMRAREAVRDTVAGSESTAPADRADHAGPFFAAAAARAETAAGELLLNGLDHGAGPVGATLLRGDGAWLLEVTDAAVEHPPEVAAGSPDVTGGLGILLAQRVSDEVGWFVRDDRKIVWAAIGDRAPARLMETLSHQKG